MTQVIIDLPEEKEKDLNHFVEFWQIKNYCKSKADAVVDIIHKMFQHHEKAETEKETPKEYDTTTDENLKRMG